MGNSDILGNVKNWIDSFYQSRQWKPNKVFLAEHIIAFCDIKSVDDFVNAEGNKQLEIAVDDFENKMIEALDEVEKGKFYSK